MVTPIAILLWKAYLWHSGCRVGQTRGKNGMNVASDHSLRGRTLHTKISVTSNSPESTQPRAEVLTARQRAPAYYCSGVWPVSTTKTRWKRRTAGNMNPHFFEFPNTRATPERHETFASIHTKNSCIHIETIGGYRGGLVRSEELVKMAIPIPLFRAWVPSHFNTNWKSGTQYVSFSNQVAFSKNIDMVPALKTRG